ncbi:hypothetical protein DY252_10245 [Thalassospira indica]|uniref:Uncharacterized protein n=1 Tax=Thalassospira indica TaxID=1891279 RepID=A0ABN5NK48_9PROT|nr:hypothetical protein DY252_10245 [Thalassospira indica]
MAPVIQAKRISVPAICRPVTSCRAQQGVANDAAHVCSISDAVGQGGAVDASVQRSKFGIGLKNGIQTSSVLFGFAPIL